MKYMFLPITMYYYVGISIIILPTIKVMDGCMKIQKQS
jgi:hypothetical protein